MNIEHIALNVADPVATLATAARHLAPGGAVLVRIPVAGQPARVIPGISGDQTYHITFADSDYLKLFHYQWLAGNPATALQKPFSVVLTESEAKRYFQSGRPEDWMGR